MLAAVVLTATLPLWLVVTLVLDVVSRPRRWARVRLGAFALVYAWLEVFAIVSALVLWVVVGCGAATRTSWGQALHSKVQSVWVRAVVAALRGILGMRVSVSGADELWPGPLILMCRHASLADTLLPALALFDSGMNVRYVLKQELQTVPSLDLFGHRLRNHFADRSGKDTAGEAAALRRLADGADEHTAMVIFPEGTRFSEGKRDRAAAKVAERHPELADRAGAFRRVLPPRWTGVQALVDGCPEADLAVFLHHGLDHLSGLGPMMRNIPFDQPVTVEFRRIPRAEVGADDFPGWLFDRWAEVDAWVQSQGEA